MAGQGITSKAAFKIETGAYGTSIAVGSGNQIPFISESMQPNVKQEQSIALEGVAGRKTLYPISRQYQGDLLCEGAYCGLLSLLIATLGMSHQNASPINTVGSAYMHYIEPSNDMSTRAFNGFEMTTPSGNAIRRGTLCFEKDTSVWEHASVMFDGFTFEASPERVTFSFKGVPYNLDFDTVTNPNSSSWSVISSDPQMIFDDMDVYLKPRDMFTITAANDVVSFDEGGGFYDVDVADGTYTGYELAQAIAAGANAQPFLDGDYHAEYDEEHRRFKIWRSDGTFQMQGDVMQMGETIGITVTTADENISQSNQDAVPDAFAAFDSGDLVGVSKISFSVENNLDVDSQDSTTGLKIVEPERNGLRVIKGQIEIPRYKNDTFIKGLNGSTTFELFIDFQSASTITGGNTYKMRFYLPQIKFDVADAPASGPQLIKQTIAFTAQDAINFADFTNFTFGEYTMRNTAAAAASVQCLGSFIDGLYGGASTGEIMKWNGSSWSTSCDFGSDAVMCIQQYGSKLYEGGSSGIIRVYDPTTATWSTSCDVGTGDVVDLELYNGNLYALESSTGKIFQFNGSSWSTSCDTAATTCKRLIAYGGNLFMLGLATTLKAYAYNGSSWSTSCDLGSASVYSACVHRGKLYVSADDGLFSFDGTTWATVVASGIGFDVKHMISYRGNLIMFSNTASSDIYVWDFGSSASVNIYSSWNTTIAYKPILYQGALFMPKTATAVAYFKPINDILITNENTISTNPL